MAKLSRSKTPAQGSSIPTPSGPGEGQDAVGLLTADHRIVEQLFGQYETADSPRQKAQLAQEICTELNVHTMLEEEIFYPACREKGVEHEALDEAQVEHDGVKLLISELMMHPVDSPFYDAKVRVLSSYVQHHVSEEERSGEGVFARAAAAGIDMKALAPRLSQRKAELLKCSEGRHLKPPALRSLDLASERRYLQQPRNDARLVPGVSSVRNKMHVRPGESGGRGSSRKAL